MRNWINLIESYNYLTKPPAVVFHGSNTPAIKDFEHREGSRFVLFNEIKTKSNGFFFALSAEEAKEYGRYVSAYEIICNKPLISGQEGVNRIADHKIEDLRYIFSAMLEEDVEGNFVVDGLTSLIQITKEELQEPHPMWIYNFIRYGGLDWECLDNAEFVSRMKERGYDGTVVYEPEATSKKSWFVISPQQIKFVDKA